MTQHTAPIDQRPGSTSLEGVTFNDRYKILSRIGGGGNAVVYRARQLNVGRDVALKLFRSHDSVFNEALLYNIRKEINFTSKLSSPYTARVYDADTDTVDGTTHIYMVQELIEGVNLQDHLLRHGPLSQLELVNVMKDILSSLKEAHSHGFIHRDLKPPNIMIRPSTSNPGRYDITVLDYGIAKSFADSEANGPTAFQTRDNLINATILYAAPEQVQKQTYTTLYPRVDLYALGMVAWHCLLGQFPLADNTKIMMAILAADVKHTPGMEIPEDLAHPGLRKLINKLLRFDPEQRYQSCDEVLQDLENLGINTKDVQFSTSYSDRPTRPEPLASSEHDKDQGEEDQGDKNTEPDAQIHTSTHEHVSKVQPINTGMTGDDTMTPIQASEDVDTIEDAEGVGTIEDAEDVQAHGFEAPAGDSVTSEQEIHDTPTEEDDEDPLATTILPLALEDEEVADFAMTGTHHHQTGSTQRGKEIAVIVLGVILIALGALYLSSKKETSEGTMTPSSAATLTTTPALKLPAPGSSRDTVTPVTSPPSNEAETTTPMPLPTHGKDDSNKGTHKAAARITPPSPPGENKASETHKTGAPRSEDVTPPPSTEHSAKEVRTPEESDTPTKAPVQPVPDNIRTTNALKIKEAEVKEAEVKEAEVKEAEVKEAEVKNTKESKEEHMKSKKTEKKQTIDFNNWGVD